MVVTYDVACEFDRVRGLVVTRLAEAVVVPAEAVLLVAAVAVVVVIEVEARGHVLGGMLDGSVRGCRKSIRRKW
jgi:hypothetical protein